MHVGYNILHKIRAIVMCVGRLRTAGAGAASFNNQQTAASDFSVSTGSTSPFFYIDGGLDFITIGDGTHNSANLITAL